MTLASYIIGSQFWFFREGDAFTVPGAGTCGQEAKPGFGEGEALDPEWIDMGAVESFEPSVSQEEYKLWRPSPGKLVLKDVLENKQEFSGKIVVNDVSGVHLELFLRTSQKLQDDQLQFNALSSISKRGWAHFQLYDQDNNLWLSIDQWCRLRCSMKWDGTPTKPEFELFGLYSSLNTGALAS